MPRSLIRVARARRLCDSASRSALPRPAPGSPPAPISRRAGGGWPATTCSRWSAADRASANASELSSSAWPTLPSEGEFPIVPPAVRTAAVAPDGNLWVSLMTPQTYVYDTAGEKTRVIEFRAAGVLAPTNFHFVPDGRLLVAPGCYTFKWR